LMKIICTDDERKRLSMTHVESNVKVEDRTDSVLKRLKLPSDIDE
jgi:hypothetical protein